MSKTSRLRRRQERREEKVKEMRGSGYLTVQQCAAEIEVTDQTILNWIAERKFPAVRFGTKCIRIAAEEWEKFKATRPGARPVVA